MIRYTYIIGNGIPRGHVFSLWTPDETKGCVGFV